MAERLLKVTSASMHAERLTPDRIEFVKQPIELDPPSPHPGFAKTNRLPDAVATLMVEKFAEPSAEVVAFALGKTAIVGIPGEPSSSIGRKIVDAGKRVGFGRVLVVSNVNGWIGYILEPEDYDKGGYEAELSFNGRRTGERVLKAAEKSLSVLAFTLKRK